jgi:hypothetical protein
MRKCWGRKVFCEKEGRITLIVSAMNMGRRHWEEHLRRGNL